MSAIPKKTGDLVDYRCLNNVIILDLYVMSHTEVPLEIMGKAKIYSKLDLKIGDKTAFVTDRASSTFLLCLSGFAMLRQHFKG